jgi:hypothetical protein
MNGFRVRRTSTRRSALNARVRIGIPHGKRRRRTPAPAIRMTFRTNRLPASLRLRQPGLLGVKPPQALDAPIAPPQPPPHPPPRVTPATTVPMIPNNLNANEPTHRRTSCSRLQNRRFQANLSVVVAAEMVPVAVSCLRDHSRAKRPVYPVVSFFTARSTPISSFDSRREP